MAYRWVRERLRPVQIASHLLYRLPAVLVMVLIPVAHDLIDPALSVIFVDYALAILFMMQGGTGALFQTPFDSVEVAFDGAGSAAYLDVTLLMGKRPAHYPSRKSDSVDCSAHRDGWAWPEPGHAESA